MSVIRRVKIKWRQFKMGVFDGQNRRGFRQVAFFKLILFVLVLSLVNLPKIVFAAKPPLEPELLRAAFKKKGHYIREGAIAGGSSGSSYSLLQVRYRNFEKQKVERLVLDLGDEKGEPLLKKVSYFHVENRPKQKRVIVDLAQTKMSKINETQLTNLLGKSPLIAKSSLLRDPESHSLTLVLDVKRPVEVEVFQRIIKKTGGKIVLDLREAKLKEVEPRENKTT